MDINNLLPVAEQNEYEVLTAQQIELVNIECDKMKNDPNYMLDWQEARKALHFDNDTE
jgi:hypothetical protein